MKEIFLINQSSNKKAASIKERLTYYRPLSEIKCTKSREESIEISDYYKDKADIIYAVGGDGTINSVVNGLYGGTAILGIIPAGTGNDFYRSIENTSKVIWTDLGYINGQYFINEASVGIDAEVCYNKEKLSRKLHLQSQMYYLSLLKTYFGYRNKELWFNQNFGKYTLIAICNGKYYGGGFKIAPNADLGDGQFDIISTYLKKLQMLKYLGKIKNGTHIDEPVFNVTRNKRVFIDSQEPLICNFDGEILVDDYFLIDNIPSGIKVYNDQELIRNLAKK